MIFGRLAVAFRLEQSAKIWRQDENLLGRLYHRWHMCSINIVPG